jgi:creatinine amidohydrolase
VTADTGVGDPSRATPTKGERYFADVTARLAGFLRELSDAAPNDLYE